MNAIEVTALKHAAARRLDNPAAEFESVRPAPARCAIKVTIINALIRFLDLPREMEHALAPPKGEFAGVPVTRPKQGHFSSLIYT